MNNTVALCIKFGFGTDFIGSRQLANLHVQLFKIHLIPNVTVCGKQFSVEYVFGCPCGGSPTICPNELSRDRTFD